MSRLKNRLKTLRKEVGKAARESFDAVEARFPLPEAPSRPSVADRLNRSRPGGATQKRIPKAKPDDVSLARMLEGELRAPGFIAMERTLPLSFRFGGRELAPILDPLPLPVTGGETFKSEKAVFLDTETTGLAGGSGTLAFLVGMARIGGDGRLNVSLLMTTTFAGERALLEGVAAFLEGAESLVTFNGKSFDAPLLTTRFRLAGMADPLAAIPGHLDLLHPVRRAFGRVWEDCRLETSERYLLGMEREDDLPGSEAPAAWLDYVRRGETDRLRGVVKHNGRDLFSLIALPPRLGAAYESPASCGADILSVARAWVDVGEEGRAFEMLEDSRASLGHEGLMALAWIYRGRGDWASALSIWEPVAAQNHPGALERLAKYHEHERHDYRVALVFTERLIQVEGMLEEHVRRQERLKRLLTHKKPTPPEGGGWRG